MDVVNQVTIMLITLGVLVTFHEYGHFWVARRNGVKVLRFSLGFGPVLFKFKDRHDTEFAISALPLGGYVKMLDEREEAVVDAEKPLAFNNKPVWSRIAIVSAGPVANFLLAILLYWFLFLQGSVGLKPVLFDIPPDSPAARAGLLRGMEIARVDGEITTTVQQVQLQLLKRIGDTGEIILGARYPGADNVDSFPLNIANWLGDSGQKLSPAEDLGLAFYQPKIAAVIDTVMEDSAAAEVGLQAGDHLLAVDGKPLADWMQWVDYVRPRAGVTIQLHFERAGQPMDVTLVPREVGTAQQSVGQVGVSVKLPPVPEELLQRQEYNLLTAWVPALERTWSTAVFSLSSLKKMVLGDISYKQLSGPISIAKVASESADSGIYSYLSLLALLSVSLGVLNLLPIPVLDGGHILFYLVEWVKGGPVPERVQQLAYQVGLFVVLSIMVLAFVNDLGRL